MRLCASDIMRDPESFIGKTVHIVVPGLVGSKFWDSLNDIVPFVYYYVTINYVIISKDNISISSCLSELFSMSRSHVYTSKDEAKKFSAYAKHKFVEQLNHRDVYCDKIADYNESEVDPSYENGI